LHDHDPFARARLPLPAPHERTQFHRARRVALLGEAFEALLEGRMPSREAALFVAGGGLAWLEQGGSLTKSYWRCAGPQGSHATEAELWRQLQARSSRREREAKSADTMEPSPSSQEL
jgi:hypothetical protein